MSKESDIEEMEKRLALIQQRFTDTLQTINELRKGKHSPEAVQKLQALQQDFQRWRTMQKGLELRIEFLKSKTNKFRLTK